MPAIHSSSLRASVRTSACSTTLSIRRHHSRSSRRALWRVREAKSRGVARAATRGLLARQALTSARGLCARLSRARRVLWVRLRVFSQPLTAEMLCSQQIDHSCRDFGRRPRHGFISKYLWAFAHYAARRLPQCVGDPPGGSARQSRDERRSCARVEVGWRLESRNAVRSTKTWFVWFRSIAFFADR